MAKLIDWGVRFELMREAIVRIAAREGAGAVNVTTVAAELDVSSSTLRRTLRAPDVLPAMGIEWLVRKRGQRALLRGRRPGVDYASVEHLWWVLLAVVPMDEAHLEQERAWRALAPVAVDERSIRHHQEEDAALDALVRRALELMGTEPSSREQQAIRLRALLDGLVEARCRSRISPEQASECLDAHLRELPCVPELREREPEPTVRVVVGGAPR